MDYNDNTNSSHLTMTTLPNTGVADVAMDTDVEWPRLQFLSGIEKLHTINWYEYAVLEKYHSLDYNPHRTITYTQEMISALPTTGKFTYTSLVNPYPRQVLEPHHKWDLELWGEHRVQLDESILNHETYTVRKNQDHSRLLRIENCLLKEVRKYGAESMRYEKLKMMVLRYRKQPALPQRSQLVDSLRAEWAKILKHQGMIHTSALELGIILDEDNSAFDPALSLFALELPKLKVTEAQIVNRACQVIAEQYTPILDALPRSNVQPRVGPIRRE
ncbi:hypothetical protein BGZ54_010327 [Gamsiella multidivaricata]|nr:hypothetical protein BGZ54_010327 [Gamsiella multidivaricata]